MRRARGRRAHRQGALHAGAHAADGALCNRARRGQGLVQAVRAEPAPQQAGRGVAARAHAPRAGRARDGVCQPPAARQGRAADAGPALGDSLGRQRARHRGRAHGRGQRGHRAALQRRPARGRRLDARGRVGARRVQPALSLRRRGGRARRPDGGQPEAGPPGAHAARAAARRRAGRGLPPPPLGHAKGGRLLRGRHARHGGGDGRPRAAGAIRIRGLRIHHTLLRRGRGLRGRGGLARRRRAAQRRCRAGAAARRGALVPAHGHARGAANAQAKATLAPHRTAIRNAKAKAASASHAIFKQRHKQTARALSKQTAVHKASARDAKHQTLRDSPLPPEAANVLRGLELPPELLARAGIALPPAQEIAHEGGDIK